MPRPIDILTGPGATIIRPCGSRMVISGGMRFPRPRAVTSDLPAPRPLRMLLAVSCVTAVAWSAGRVGADEVGLRILPPSPAHAPALHAAAPDAAPAPVRPTFSESAGPIIARDLFSTGGAPQPSAPARAADRADLQLLATLVATNPGESSALIATAAGSTRGYGVGDRLGTATVSVISARQVRLVGADGAESTLTMGGGPATPAATPDPSPPAAPAVRRAELLAILDNPAELQSLAKARRPGADGRADGYRLGGVVDPLSRLGLPRRHRSQRQWRAAHLRERGARICEPAPGCHPAVHPPDATRDTHDH